MAGDRTIRVRFRAELTDLKRGMAEAAAITDKTSARFDKNGRKIETVLGRATRSVELHRDAWNQAGTALAAFGAGGIAAVAAATHAAIEWESAFAGVLKTVDGTAEEISHLEQQLRAMALIKPANQTEIAAVAAAAGQLGVRVDDVADFTAVMIDLGEATNLTADEAATALARIANIMGTTTGDVGRMGSVIVELGNNSATTEAEIVALTTRLAAAGKQAGLSEADIFAFGSTMTSVGVEAEAGGTAMSKVFTAIKDASLDGGDSLATFARVAGVSTDRFREMFERDAASAVAAFVEGMGRLSSAGESTTSVFEELELTDERLKRSVLSVGSAAGLLTTQLRMANREWSDANALQDEASKRYATTESKIQIARNAIRDAGIELGEVFLPIVTALANGVGGLASMFSRLPEPAKAVIAGLTGITSVGAAAAGMFLLLGPRVLDTYVAFKKLEEVNGVLAGRLKGLGKAGGLLAVATIGVAGLGAAVEALPSVSRKAAHSLAEVSSALLDLQDGGSRVEGLFGFSDDVFGLTGSVDSMADAARRLTDPSLLDRMYDFRVGLLGIFGVDAASSATRTTDELAVVGEHLASLVQAGDAERAADQFLLLSNQWRAGGGSVSELLEFMPAYSDALTEIENQQRMAGGSTEELANITAELASVQEQVTAADERATEARKEWTEAITAWRAATAGAFESFVDNPGAYQSVIDGQIAWAQSVADSTKSADDAWQDYYDGFTVKASAYIDALESQVERQSAWSDDVLAVQERINENYSGAALDEATRQLEGLVMMGSQSSAADLIGGLADWSDADFAKIVDLWAQSGADAAADFTTAFEGSADPFAQLRLDMTKADEDLQHWVDQQEVLIAAKLDIETPKFDSPFQIVTDEIFALPDGIARRADGGPIHGPGTSTSDSILIRASDDEHMVAAREVQGFGGHDELAVMRAYARAGKFDDYLMHAASPAPQVVTVPVHHTSTTSAPVNIYTSAPTLRDAEAERRRRLSDMRRGR